MAWIIQCSNSKCGKDTVAGDIVSWRGRGRARASFSGVASFRQQQRGDGPHGRDNLKRNFPV